MAVNETARRIAALSPEQREMLMRRLREEQESPAAPPELPRLPPEPADHHAPAPMTDAQEAFWIGRSGIFDLGGCGANVYLEYEFPEVAWPFAEALSTALDRIVQRHEILRSVVLPDGRLQLLPEVPPFEVRVEDLSRLSDEALEQHLERVRDDMRYAFRPIDRWPLFEVLVHQVKDGLVRLHARFDALLIDGTARGVLLTEIALTLANPAIELPPLDLSFLDYSRALAEFQESAAWQRDRDYWLERMPLLPPAPRLPLVREVGPDTVPRIVKRNEELLPAEPWQALKQRAAQAGLTPSGLLTAAFAEALRPWSESPDFTLGIVGSYQPDIHPHLRRVIGTFNTVHLLAAAETPGSFEERAGHLQRRMTEDIDHQHYSGLRVLRELNRQRGAGPRATLPVLFDSVVEYSHSSYRPGGAAAPEEAGSPLPAQVAGESPEPAEGAEPPQPPQIRLATTEIDLMISLPQVLLLVVALEEEGALNLISQAVEEVLPPALTPELIAGYRRLLERLAAEPAAWQEARPAHPPAAFAPPQEAGAAPPRALEERLGIAAEDRVLVTGGLDLSFPSGAAVIAAGSPDPATLVPQIARDGVTVLCAPPTLAEALVSQAEQDRKRFPRSLRLAVLWGEAVPATLPARLKAFGIRTAALWPDPATGRPLAAAVLREEDAGAPLRVEPLPGVDLQVLDGAGTPRPPQVAGELTLGGDPPAGTGQRARLLPDGRIEILDAAADLPARLGAAADLQRAEAVLQEHPGLRHAVVGVRGDRLVAWIVPRPGRSPSDTVLRRALRDRFPEHRVPTDFVRLPALPLGAGGRLDRAALPAPAAPGTGEAVAAWGELETRLAALWAEILGHRPESPRDDFFAIGGDSLSATRLLARIAAVWGAGIPAGEVFAHPTLSGMAAAIRRAEEASRPSLLARLTRWARGGRARSAPSNVRAFSRPEGQGARSGMRLFLIIWVGQLISGLGTGLGTFALGVWIYRQNLSATQFTMVGFAAMVTGMLMLPVAGSVADRYDRRMVILFGDTGAAIMTLLMAIALYTDQLRIWHVYPIAILMTAFSTLQGPALMAAVSALVPRRQLVRAGAMSQLIGTVTAMTTPLAAGVLVDRIGYHGVILIDFSTFFAAAGTLLFVRFPTGISRNAGDAERRSVLSDMRIGWNYLAARPGLMSLLVLFAVTNFSSGIVQSLMMPLILGFASTAELGTVQSAAAVGGLVGSVILSAWGGPSASRRVWAIFYCMILQGALLFLGGFEPSIPLVACALFLATLTAPIIGGCSQAIWQSKVALELQGRILGLRGFIGSATVPLAYLLAGPLADRVFEPLLRPGGGLAGSVGRYIGVGQGRGIGLLFIVIGFFMIGVVVLSFLNPRLRHVEEELEDAPRPSLDAPPAAA